jgi:hypothetical protein
LLEDERVRAIRVGDAVALTPRDSIDGLVLAATHFFPRFVHPTPQALDLDWPIRAQHAIQ